MGLPPILSHLLLLLLPLLLSNTAAADDSTVMLKLAAALTPTPSSWSTTSATGYCSKWDGISCDSSNSVTAIRLAKKGVSGTLPAELSTLSQLQSLSLQQNQLSGALPSLANISTLQEIYLDSNNFTSIPQGFFQGLTSLQIFSISQNNLLASWSIPTDLTQSASLNTFEASQANIVGSIPDIFGSLPSLQNLRLSYNNLTGTLPVSLAISGIQNLWVNNQEMGLTGNINVLSSMAQLKQVWLQKNQFSGPIPDLSKCVNLFDLQLGDNQFTGILPASLVSLPALLKISLSNNKLQGPVLNFPKDVEVDNSGINNFCVSTPGVACNPQVTTLLQIAGAFGYPATLSDSWDGNNACNNWAFITCDTQSRVVTVNLAKQHFTGTISPAFANLTALRNLYLSDNNLTGSIPDSLTSLAQLQVLDVSNNNLTGGVPSFASSVKLIATPGNSLLGKGTDTGSGGTATSGSNTNSSASSGNSGGSGNGVSPGLIAGIFIATVIFIAVVLFVLFKCIIKKRRGKSDAVVKDEENGNTVVKNRVSFYTSGYGVISDIQSQSSGNHVGRHFFEGGNVVISIEVLRQVTDNFSEKNILGQGGFGVVYKGELHDGTKIAVKRMEAAGFGTKGMDEFQAEIAVLTKVRHRHLVALLGYGINGNERLLVYEYMPQGTLAQHLFEWREHGYPPLTWKQRITIALDVARGVEYLHSLAQQSFIHRDLKPSNILLGDDIRAKVADFGFVKLAPHGKYSIESRLVGTFGYLALEYAATGRVTTKVDVYAFGVILMEIITGRKALDDTMPDERSHLVAWFRRVIINKENLPKAIDETLKNPDEDTLVSISKVAELAGHCTARDRLQRPDMGHAVNILGPLVELWKPACQEEEDTSGIKRNLSLPQFLQRWQADEVTPTMFCGMSY